MARAETDVGVCRNPQCPNGASGARLERYPGPGEWCPACGERLEVADGVLPPELFDRLHHALGFTVPQPARRAPSPWAVGGAIALVAVALVVALLALKGGLRPASAAVRVCSSSMTARLADDVVAAWSAGDERAASRADAASGAACDVRFSVEPNASRDRVVAHDALVVIVNPANPLARIAERDVRAAVAGTVADWSALSSARGPIAVLLPPDAGDEGRLLAQTLLRGISPGARVTRLPSSAAVTRVVASASGRTALGIVAFSASVPARVVALGAGPPPSSLSIATHRYPLSFAVVADASHDAGERAADLVRFARSRGAQSIAVHDGLVSRDGI